MKDLPPIEDEIATVDIESLESSSWSLGAKYVKKGQKGDPSPASGKIVEKPKTKKRKRKRIMPRHYDASVAPDPERWLPRWQRTAFKKKKDRRGVHAIGKGTQGTMSGDPGETFSKPSPKPGQAKDSPQGPRQQRPTAQKKKKKTGRK